MILSEFIRVMDLSWNDILLGIFYFTIAFGGYTALVIFNSRLLARKDFIKNELPTVHKNALQREQSRNSILEQECKLTKDMLEEKIKEVDKLKARLLLIKTNYEIGLKGE